MGRWGDGKQGRVVVQVFSPLPLVPNAQCPMPNAQCPKKIVRLSVAKDSRTSIMI
ncbi:hypothetical protein [Nostoc linckia]|uniref:hypothetical protein n=1 Tax=Nostoc linckia TaxID=92942 RepID=UPI0015D50DAB|nr:hypothetical protein [Nostoc linckia]